MPSLALNFYLYQKYYIFFYGASTQVINLFLKPNGKQIIVETNDKETREVNITDIYEPKVIDTKYEQRIDFNHGANNFLFLRGNSLIYDGWALTQILENHFINTRDAQYSFDLTKDEFTWEFKDLVEIKKRKRIVNKIVKPTPSNLSQLQRARLFVKAKT